MKLCLSTNKETRSKPAVMLCVAFAVFVLSSCSEEQGADTGRCYVQSSTTLPLDHQFVHTSRPVLTNQNELLLWSKTPVSNDRPDQFVLWRYSADESNSTLEQLVQVDEVDNNFFGIEPNFLAMDGDTVYVSIETEDTGREVWSMNINTPDSLQLMFELAPGPEDQDINWMIKAGGSFYVSVHSDTINQKIYEWRPEDSFAPQLLIDSVPDYTYANDEAPKLIGNELLVGVGESQVLRIMTDDSRGPEIINFPPNALNDGFVFNDQLLFSALDAVSDRYVLWVYQPSVSTDPFKISDVQGPSSFFTAGNILYFVAGERRLLHEYLPGGTAVQIRSIATSGSGRILRIKDTFYFARYRGIFGSDGIQAYDAGAEFGESVINYGGSGSLNFVSPLFNLDDTLHVVESQGVSSYTKLDQDCQASLRYAAVDPQ